MADTLKIKNGLVRVDIADIDGEVIGSFKFAPTDTKILERYEKVVDHMNGIKIDPNAEEGEQGAMIRALEKDIAEQFDFLFGYSVAEGIFARCGALTIDEDGDFFFENVIEGVGGLIEKYFKKRIEKKLKKVRAAASAIIG